MHVDHNSHQTSNTILAYGVADAVRATGLSRSTIYDFIKTGQLPIRKAGRKTLILRRDLEALLDQLPSEAA